MLIENVVLPHAPRLKRHLTLILTEFIPQSPPTLTLRSARLLLVAVFVKPALFLRLLLRYVLHMIIEDLCAGTRDGPRHFRLEWPLCRRVVHRSLLFILLNFDVLVARSHLNLFVVFVLRDRRARCILFDSGEALETCENAPILLLDRTQNRASVHIHIHLRRLEKVILYILYSLLLATLGGGRPMALPPFFLRLLAIDVLKGFQ
jgi:hypothetical protein